MKQRQSRICRHSGSDWLRGYRSNSVLLRTMS